MHIHTCLLTGGLQSSCTSQLGQNITCICTLLYLEGSLARKSGGVSTWAVGVATGVMAGERIPQLHE